MRLSHFVCDSLIYSQKRCECAGTEMDARYVNG